MIMHLKNNKKIEKKILNGSKNNNKWTRGRNRKQNTKKQETKLQEQGPVPRQTVH